MKIAYMVALLMIVLMVGCATQEAAPAAPAAPAEEAVTEEAAEEAPVVVEGDIVVTSAGFDPAETTVLVGTTLVIKSAEGRHKFTVNGETTQILEEGAAIDITFDKLGEIRVFDILTKKSAYVTVTEEIAEEEVE